MSKVARFLTMSGVAALAGAASLGAQNPVPPVKVGLWQTQMSQLDANGKEVPSPQVAAFAKMAPAVRAQMAEMMRSRGMQMPDANGVMKTCLTRETLDSPAWQQMAADTGCTTTYSARSSSVWKWHSTCPSMKSESDGETTFTGLEAAFPRDGESIREGRAYDLPASCLAVQHRVDDARHPVPGVFFPGELTPACRRDAVKPRLAIGLRSAPLPAEQATLLQPRQMRGTACPY